MVTLSLILVVLGSIYGKFILEEDKLKPTLISKGFRSEDDQGKWAEMNDV